MIIESGFKIGRDDLDGHFAMDLQARCSVRALLSGNYPAIACDLWKLHTNTPDSRWDCWALNYDCGPNCIRFVVLACHRGEQQAGPKKAT